MSEPLVVAALALIGVLGAAILSVFGILFGLFWKRIVTAEATNNSLWLYTRVLIDAYYRDVKRAPPPPPDFIAHLYEGTPT